jgi:hypothetical protein
MGLIHPGFIFRSAKSVARYTIFRSFSAIRSLTEARTVYLWQDDYIRALAETDPVKQQQLVYHAMVAIEQRRLSPLEPGSDEDQAIQRAERALQILKRSLSED